MPLQHWRRMSSSFSVLPGDVEKALRGEGPIGPSTLHRAMRDLLSTPALGYTREWQEELQELGQQWLEHAQSVQRYESVLGKVTSKAVELWGARTMALAREGKLPDSLRENYDLWVDCAEEAYAEIATSDEFAEVQARLTNSLMALKHHEQQLGEELQSALNMPTRSELDTSHRRVHGLRRELRNLQSQLEEQGLEALYEKIEALEKEVKTLRSTTGAAPRPKAASRKKAAPKKKQPTEPKTNPES
jgi:class III poly(R)-hydroxyalkanoic acid synthase PhaE subunit